MNLNIDIYLTTKKDELPDLKSYTDEEGFYEWKRAVKFVAFKQNTQTEVSERLLEDAREYPIIEAFALIEYPPGKVLEADEDVGERLREFFQKQHIKFNWALTRDEKSADTCNVSLELIVEKD